MSAPTATFDGESSGGGERTINLHPLVIINISEHFTRNIANKLQSAQNFVFGILFGIQNGLVVDIFNTYEMTYNLIDGRVQLIDEHIEATKEQFTAIFPKYELLGWYRTGPEVLASDLAIQREMTKFNESPLFLLLNPDVSHHSKDLPVSIYESEIHVQNDTPTMLFVRTNFKIETLEMERIAVDHVARVTPSDGTSALNLHLDTVKNAITKVNDRVEVVLKYLQKVKENGAEVDHRILRQIARICNQLPALESPAFEREFVADYNDTLLVSYLASITKGVASMNDIVDKFQMIQDSRRRVPM